MNDITIDNASADEAAEIAQRLITFNRKQAGPENVAHIALSLKRSDGLFVGGIIAAKSWDTLIIDALWVDELERGQGYGKQLIAMAEQRGVELGCKLAVLETFSFQADGFYLANGYKTVGTVAGWPPSGSLSRMVKML